MTGFLGVIQRNINAGADSIPLFEIANTYRSPGKQKHPAEERVCAIALYGKFAAKSWKDAARPVSFYDLKGIVEAVAEYAGCRELCSAKAVRSYLLPETSQEIRMWQNPVGFFGQVAPAVLRQWDIKDPVFYAELSIDKMLAPGDAPRKFRDWPRYPAVERDLSLMVRDEVRCSDLMHEIRALGGGLVSGVGLFDLFRGKRVPEGFKNLAFRVVYRSPEKTLIAEEIQKLHDRIAETLVKKYQAQFQK
ncbi:MAG: Phenylalanine--tRNA ligase beta subunit [Candidatus Omnitrophica bacterium ADurb.Bin277]|nr:MAG: Phenylalanine--tRNA ligase beta subunit [Candidatus Omnitrophica bacterium ADurb.Bin277]